MFAISTGFISDFGFEHKCILGSGETPNENGAVFIRAKVFEGRFAPATHPSTSVYPCVRVCVTTIIDKMS